MKLLVSVPTFGPVRPKCFQSVYAMRVPPGLRVKVAYTEGYGPARARNLAAQESLDGGYGAVLWLDSDQVAPPETVDRLLRCGSPVAAGWSMMAAGDDRTNVATYDAERKAYGFIRAKDLPKGVIDVAAVGFAGVLVRTEALKAMPYPWFDYVEYPNRATLSEDLFFCDSARRRGLAIKCDTSLKLGHVKEAVI